MIRTYGARNGRLVRIDDGVVPKAEIAWLDLHEPTPEEERAAEALLGLQVPTRQEMAEIEESSRLYFESGAAVMTVVVIDGVSRGRPQRVQVTFVLTPDHLVTVRYADPSPFRNFEARESRQGEPDLAAGMVFAALLESIVERLADVLELVAAELSKVSAAIFFEEEGGGRKHRRSNGLQHLLIQLGRKNLTLGIVRESLLSLSRLVPFARQGVGWLKEGGGGRLKGVERDVRSLAAFETQLSAEIGFLQESTLGLINIEQNAIIKVLSVAAVLFLPPTLVGTVYGMNFVHLPELDWAFGYPFALLLMLASALVAYLWLRAKGWF